MVVASTGEEERGGLRRAAMAWDDDDLTDCWDPATGSFNGLHLHRFMIRGEWTAQRLAERGVCSEGTIYRALRGHRVHDRTAGAIIAALRTPFRSAA
jgi:hypothetical protein